MNSQSGRDGPLLSIEGLHFAFRSAGTASPSSLALIDNLQLSVFRGEIVCILGASGCGKTTLLNLIAGLLKPEAGKIEILNSRAAAVRQPIGYIFQNDALLPWRTIEGNLRLADDIGGNSSKEGTQERIAAYLKTFHLDRQILKQYPSQLSGGMRQRASIIQALMFDPDLLLLDEPFSALDYYTKLRLEGEFHQLVKGENKGAILVTHDIEEAVAMGDRLVIMDAGRLGNELSICKSDDRCQPENARGMPEFAEHYRQVWSQLKSVIEGARC